MLGSVKGFGEKEKKIDRKKLIRIFGIAALLGFLIAFSVRFWILFPFTISNSEMSPTYPSGKRVYIFRWIRPDSLFLGNVVLTEHPTQKNKVVLARIVGKPGDSISIQDKVVYRNGVSETEGSLPFSVQHSDNRPPFASGFSQRDNLSPVRIEDRNYFLLCDNRDDCTDSRDFGPIGFDKILGKVL
ncbi:signal peptidase I [Leptospira wolffii]|uniref:signal peptidase I n=1 Tax=Leptospira wolffii TaxID=409998 RepID=UPI001084043B|nr:signal peptidase I [Leptospira wolffii]TGK60170.1 signal peptidase I [Leptospira wolffii]TGK72512.1 signal peptidase I [Leptospira wolffii]TGK76177.1 signal peptidase I [Leptospira wolffii]TGL30429.1 signal peptidase I [Leptospira wolffii]